jgi:hypothetical protein
MRATRIAIPLALLFATACGSGTRPSPPVGDRPPEFATVHLDPGLSIVDKVERLSSEWDASYATKMGSLSTWPDAVVTEAFATADMLGFYVTLVSDDRATAAVDTLSALHAVLATRERLTDGQTHALFDRLIALRRIDQARALQAAHETLREREIPSVRFASDFDPAVPATMTLAADGAWDVANISLANPHAVFVIGCPISAKAVEAIAADVDLMRTLDATGVTWLTDASVLADPAIAIDWNQRFPDQPMQIAWSNGAWVSAGVGFESMPDFRYLRDGVVVERHEGWDPATTLPQVRASLVALASLRTDL